MDIGIGVRTAPIDEYFQGKFIAHVHGVDRVRDLLGQLDLVLSEGLPQVSEQVLELLSKGKDRLTRGLRRTGQVLIGNPGLCP